MIFFTDSLMSIILYTRLPVFELFFVYAIAGVKVILRATIQERHSRARSQELRAKS